MREKLLRRREVEEITRLSRASIYKLIDEGKFPPHGTRSPHPRQQFQQICLLRWYRCIEGAAVRPKAIRTLARESRRCGWRSLRDAANPAWAGGSAPMERPLTADSCNHALGANRSTTRRRLTDGKSPPLTWTHHVTGVVPQVDDVFLASSPFEMDANSPGAFMSHKGSHHLTLARQQNRPGVRCATFP